MAQNGRKVTAHHATARSGHTHNAQKIKAVTIGSKKEKKRGKKKSERQMDGDQHTGKGRERKRKKAKYPAAGREKNK